MTTKNQCCVCKNEMKDDGYTCESCNQDHHPECAGDTNEGTGEYPSENAYSYCKLCTGHQSDSVVEEIVEEYNFLRDRFGNDYNFNVWLYHKLTTLKQTAQQEKEELVRGILEELENEDARLVKTDQYDHYNGKGILYNFTSNIKAIAQARGISISVSDMKKRKPPRARATCRKCGIKFSYKPVAHNLTRDICEDCRPQYGAATPLTNQR